jgi:hypothetical protein
MYLPCPYNIGTSAKHKPTMAIRYMHMYTCMYLSQKYMYWSYSSLVPGPQKEEEKAPGTKGL